MRRSVLIRLVIALAVVSALGVLFVRSVRSSRAAPFAVEQASLSGWRLARHEPARFGVWLALSPPEGLALSLGREVFRRGGESVSYPTPPLLPLLLQDELDRVAALGVAPQAVVDAARASGLESAAFAPRCMGYRRVSEPGITRAVYFVLFDAPAYDGFREEVQRLVLDAGGTPSSFDPARLSPALIVAALDGAFDRWMPLRADAQADCLAPIEAQ